ncbi:MAG TPA: ABC transporter permease [Casimicrobiaceae bacterium]|nr:ABC transporter permease [Casimicrobiaceae bacterium]
MRRKSISDPDFPLVLPLASLFIAFFVAPFVVLLALSLQSEQDARAFSLAQYAKFFGDTFNLTILVSTVWLAIRATLVCVLFGYPIAWVCARAPARWQSLLVFVVVLPILTSVVVRTFAWIVILGREGVMNHALRALGLIDQPVPLLFTETGVIVVLAQVQMPLMVLPLFATLSRLDPNLGDASSALGAGAWRTFFSVTLPLSTPGLVAGCILVFSACATAFVTQTLIGGARLVYMPLHIYQQAIGANNWPFAAAISVVFTIAVMTVIYGLNRFGRASKAYGDHR